MSKAMVTQDLIQDCRHEFDLAIESLYNDNLGYENLSSTILKVINKLGFKPTPPPKSQDLFPDGFSISKQFKQIKDLFNNELISNNSIIQSNLINALSNLNHQYRIMAKTYFSNENVYSKLMHQLSPHNKNNIDLKVLIDQLHEGFGKRWNKTNFKAQTGRISDYEKRFIQLQPNEEYYRRRLRASVINSMFSLNPMHSDHIGSIISSYSALQLHYKNIKLDTDKNEPEFNKINSFLKEQVKEGNHRWINILNALSSDSPKFISETNLMVPNLLYLNYQREVKGFKSNSWIDASNVLLNEITLKDNEHNNLTSISVTLPSYAIISNDNEHKISLGMTNDEPAKLKLIELLDINLEDNIDKELNVIISEYNLANPKSTITLVNEPVHKTIDFYNLDQIDDEINPDIFVGPNNINKTCKLLSENYESLRKNINLDNFNIVTSMLAIEQPKLFEQIKTENGYFKLYESKPLNMTPKEQINMAFDNSLSGDVRKKINKNTQGIMFK